MFISVTCGGSLSQKQGNFTSPLYPSFYPPAKDCKWTITVCTTLPFPSPSSAWTFTPHTPLAPPPPSPCLACHERDAEAALLLSTSSIFICQTAVSTAVLAGLQCFVCSVEFVGVHVVCACARAQFHDSCGLVCILVLCVKGEKKKKKTISYSFVLQVAPGSKVRLRFTMFRMKEPGVDTRLCHKDYVEIMGNK